MQIFTLSHRRRLIKTLVVMKLTILLIILACFKVSASVYGQTITLNERNAPLSKIFKQIEQQSGYSFFYKNDLLKQTNPVTIHVDDGKLSEVLDRCFRNQPITYDIVDNTIIVKPKEKSLLQKVQRFLSAPLNIKGRVTDTAGRGLPGAVIKVKGTERAVTANDNGEFEISGVDENTVLIITYIGYITAEVPVNDAENAQVKVILRPDVAQLESVNIVSTGYQTIPKERATGAFTQIDNKTINRNVGINILDRLEGVSSGFLLNRGLPSIFGANNSKISVRGRSTIFGNAEPLVVLDGLPYEGTVDQINPADIESITILKDAAAASIWGTRAGNGVIVITSKKGNRNQKLSVGISSTISFTGKPDLDYLPYLSSSDFIDIEQNLFNQGYYDGNLSTGYSPVSPAVEIFNNRRNQLISATDSATQINALKSQNVRDGLKRYAYRTAVYQQHQFNINGGGENNQYYMSAGYDKNLGNLVSEDYDRLSLTANNTYYLLKNRLQFSGAISFISSNTNNQADNYTPNTPYDQLADSHGNALPVVTNLTLRLPYTDTVGNGKLLDWHYRPKDEFNANNNIKLVQYKINGGLKLIITNWLNLTSNYQYLKETTTSKIDYGVDRFYTRNFINQFSTISGNEVIRSVPLGGIIDNINADLISKTIRLQLNFNKTIGQSHEITAIAGYEGSDSRINANALRLYGYNPKTLTNGNNSINPLMGYPYFYDPYQIQQLPTASELSNATNINQSFYANASYSYKQKYILYGSARRDESNIFGVNTNRKGIPLWSTGVAWNADKEPFFSLTWLSSLKLRASYGYNGNVDKTVSGLLTVLNFGQINQFGSPYTLISNPPNPNLRWEKIKTWNAGVDFEIKGGRLSGSIDVYQKNATDLISNNPIAMQTGVTQYKGNAADLNSKGIEAMLNSNNLSGTVKWRTTVLFNYNTDKVASYKLKQSSNINIVSGNFSNPLEGYPYYAIFSFPSAGLTATGRPQGYLNGQPSSDYGAIMSTLDPGQLKYHGSASPQIFGSLINTFNYKNLELSFNILYKFDYYFRRTNVFNGLTTAYETVADYSNRWQKPGDELTTRVPAFVYPQDAGGRFFQNSEDVVEKGDHIRLQDIKLSYMLSNLPRLKALFKSANIFFYARNLGIIWRKNKYGVDPDYGITGIPQPFNCSVGINLNLK